MIYAKTKTDARKNMICKNMKGRLKTFKIRLKKNKVTHDNIDVYSPYLKLNADPLNIIQWGNLIDDMLRRMIPKTATYEKDEPNTEQHKKQTVELDHVIPLSWIWTHRDYFKEDVARVNIIFGWYNVLPISCSMNRRKTNYTPSVKRY